MPRPWIGVVFTRRLDATRATTGKGGIMLTLGKTTKRLIFACGLLAATIGVAFGSGVLDGSKASAAPRRPAAKPIRAILRQAPGTWRRLPAAPVEVDVGLTSVWTGTEMIVSGVRADSPNGSFVKSTHVAAAFNPASQTWRELPSGPKTPGYCRRGAVWTGKEMLVWACDQFALNPATNTWRSLPAAPTQQGIVAWTGSELIGWGGGCCGDVSADGSAYDPNANTWRKLAPAPVPGQQSPTGAWTGRELVIFNGRDPDGKPVGGAAYNPTTDTWRRIPPMPGPNLGGTAVWDGHEILIVGRAVGLAFDPRTTHYRRLPPMDTARRQPIAVWTGKQLLVWGGQIDGGAVADGVVYEPRANRWEPILDGEPLEPRFFATGVWTGRKLIIWGGITGTVGTSSKYLSDGAALIPIFPAPMPPQCCGG
jgi:hypothetical protein